MRIGKTIIREFPVRLIESKKSFESISIDAQDDTLKIKFNPAIIRWQPPVKL